MKLSSIPRHIRDGFLNLFRNGWMSFASITAIAVSLSILGVFLLLVLNVNHMAGQLESKVEISVYLSDSNSKQDNADLQKQIEAFGQVKSVKFVSKDEGLQQLMDKLGPENASIVEGYEGDENPLPNKLVVKALKAEQTAHVASQIEGLNQDQDNPPIEKIEWGKDIVERLLKITDIIRNVGIVLVLGLTLTAMFLISNTIKLTILSRKREISIMKLVGATNGFIRFPFFVEGMLLGIFGSAIPIGLLIYGYYELVVNSRVQLGVMMIDLLPWTDVWMIITISLSSIGVLLGIWGTTVSVRKFLKV